MVTNSTVAVFEEKCQARQDFNYRPLAYHADTLPNELPRPPNMTTATLLTFYSETLPTLWLMLLLQSEQIQIKILANASLKRGPRVTGPGRAMM